MKRILSIITTCVLFCIATEGQLQIATGTSWKSSSNTYVVLDDIGLKHDATSNLLDNIFRFTGNNDNTISGNTLPLFNTIQLNKNNAAKLSLGRSINANQVLFQSGLFDLNNFIVDLGTTGSIIGETETSRFTGTNGGYVQIINTLNAPSSSNPGNLGAIITSSQNLGNVTIRRGHTSQVNGSGTGNSVLRYFDIIPENNTNLNATFRFTYLDAELNGLDENTLVLWKSDNFTDWSIQGFTTRDNQSDYVEKTGINNFSRWTLSTPDNPLPVLWNSFNTQCVNGQVVISWKTLIENNTKSFIIQKTTTGNNWIQLSALPAAGFTNTITSYSYTDMQQQGNAFYRIAQVDINGHILFSPVFRSACVSNENFKAYPNPTSGMTWISLQNEGYKNMNVQLYDAKGVLLNKQVQALQPGTNIFGIDLSKFPAGSYNIVLMDEVGNIKTIKVQKN